MRVCGGGGGSVVIPDRGQDRGRTEFDRPRWKGVPHAPTILTYIVCAYTFDSAVSVSVPTAHRSVSRISVIPLSYRVHSEQRQPVDPVSHLNPSEEFSTIIVTCVPNIIYESFVPETEYSQHNDNFVKYL